MSEQFQDNLEDRDPNEINGHLKVQMQDVIAEPAGTHTLSCVWVCSKICFTCCRKFWYNVCSILLGVFIAIYWGIDFAMMSFCHVWCVTPCIRQCMMQCNMCQKCFGTCINCCLAPICETAGLCFSGIQVKNS